MSALGHEPTSRNARRWSGLPPKANIGNRGCDVRLGPQADVVPATGPKMDLLDHPIGTGNRRLLRERRKLPFAWRRLDHLGEWFSIVEELGPLQDRRRGA